MPFTKIFFTGATGYIGGSVLERLLSHRVRNDLQITAMVRSEIKANVFRALGLRAVVGSNADSKLLTTESADADLVFSCSNCDDVDAIQAILAGMKLHWQRTGEVASLVHTSGTGVLAIQTHGMAASDVIYSDMDIPKLETLDPLQPHRPVDLAIVEADEAGYAKTYIVLPSNVYGRAKGLLVDLGVQGVKSIQIPILVDASIARGQAGIVGKGLNLCGDVDIVDLTDLYMILLDTIFATMWTRVQPPKEFQHGRHGFYFASTDEHNMYDVSKRMASAMHHLGIGTAEPTRFEKEELVDASPILHSFMGMNARCTSDRSRALGWKPTKVTQDFIDSVEEEVYAALDKL